MTNHIASKVASKRLAILSVLSKDQQFHYVYRITNTVDRKYYYGVRSSKCHPKEDNYWSSSKSLKPLIKENPDQFIKKIVKMFRDRVDAINYEICLHDKFDVGANPKFYNKAKQMATGHGFSYQSNLNKKLSEKTKRKISKANKGVNHPLFGKTPTEETRKKISKSSKGKAVTKEARQNISKALQEKFKKEITCPHCNLTGRHNMIRYHFDNCKKKSIL